MNDEIMNLMMKFGREHPEGFQPKDLLDYLISNGIDIEEARQIIDFQFSSMEDLD